MNRKLYVTVLTVLFLAAATGCTSAAKKRPLEPEKRFRKIALTRFAPEPVYNRLKITRPPSPRVHPAKPMPPEIPYVLPEIHLISNEKTLCEIGESLSNAMKYQFYCSSVIGTETFTVEARGDIEALGRFVAKEGGIAVTVNHDRNELKFLPVKE